MSSRALDAAFCSHLKAEGNKLLKAGQLQEAIDEYTKGVERAEKTLSADDGTILSEFTSLAVALLCNRSLASLNMANETTADDKVLEFAKIAQEDARQAISLDPQNSKVSVIVPSGEYSL